LNALSDASYYSSQLITKKIQYYYNILQYYYNIPSTTLWLLES